MEVNANLISNNNLHDQRCSDDIRWCPGSEIVPILDREPALFSVIRDLFIGFWLEPLD